jgi:hypothetical protein
MRSTVFFVGPVALLVGALAWSCSSYLTMAAAPHFDMQIKLLMIGDSG